MTRYRLIVVVLCLPLLLLVPAAVYVRPHADDFCIMGMRDIHGVAYGFVAEYHEWSGRYSANLLELALNGYSPLFTILCVGIWIVALYAIVDRHLQHHRASMALAVIIVLASIAIAPNPYESFIWLQGATTYLAAIVAYTVVIALLSYSVPAAALIAFIAAGFSDLGALLGTFALISMALISRERYKWILVTVMSALGLALVMLAPGNAVRQASFPSPNMLWAAMIAVQTIGHLVMTHWPILLASLALAFCVGRWHGRCPAPRWFIVGAFWILGGATAAWFAGLYSTSNYLPARAWAIPQYLMLIGLGVWMYLLGRHTATRNPPMLVIAVCVAVIWIGAIVNLTMGVSATRNYAELYDSGRMLVGAEDWIVSCASRFYDTSPIEQAGY